MRAAWCWPTAPSARAPFLSLRLAAPAFTDIANASGQDGADILARGARGEPMASFDFSARLQARFATRERSYSSANVLAVLPGTDPALAHEPVLLIAHLDGYGYGTPVNGDSALQRRAR